MIIVILQSKNRDKGDSMKYKRDKRPGIRYEINGNWYTIGCESPNALRAAPNKIFKTKRGRR